LKAPPVCKTLAFQPMRTPATSLSIEGRALDQAGDPLAGIYDIVPRDG